MDLLPCLFYLGTVLVLCCGFSVDVNAPIIFRINTESFGRSVAQIGNVMLAGAPFQTGEENETGKLYQCAYQTGGCKAISIQRPADAVNMSLGLSLAAQGSQALVCGPTVYRACGTNMYVNGYCFLLDQNLQQLQRFPESLPECSARPTDIVFLIDGSGSIETLDFERMKVFVSEVIKRLSGRDTLFALMQFSNRFQEHFNFNSQDPVHQVMEIHQLGGWTHTATAINKVMQELFTAQKGSRKEATKILIVITDGRKETDPLQYGPVIQKAMKAGIIRYAIGVGSAFSDFRAREELNTIASEPDEEHVFAVTNFDALRGIQDQLQDKIFAIEGTQSQSSSSFEMEMAQEGFSALLTPEGSVLGAVGAYDWSGGVFLYQNNRDSSFINVSSTVEDMKDAYLGYSSKFIQLNGRSGLVVGAPRYNHVGKVVHFERPARNKEWQLKTEAVGEQVGSYFGASLCSVDLNKDGNTDLVLVGAPMYYDAVTGGRVYVCQFKGKALHCHTSLKGQAGHIFGRFGASMAETGDITGDGLTDVVIGAPMEDENMGALYVFSGSRTSINPQYSQRIEGLQFSGRHFYFGQAVSGGTDLTGDGLMDITVGRQGQILLLRSSPLLRVGVSIAFVPNLIPTSVFQCRGQEPLQKAASKAHVCFDVSKVTQDSFGELFSDLRYSLALDSERTKIRASFSTKSSVFTTGFQTGLGTRCQDYQIELPICTEDILTPITLRLNYSLVGKPIARTQGLTPVLSKDSRQVYIAQLPFEKNCDDDVCKDILRISFTYSGLSTLVVGLTPELNVTASIQNLGEDSYSTTMLFFYPAGVSYRKVTLLQLSSRVMSIKCNSAPASEEDVGRNATCNVNHPIFWSGAKVNFVATFDVSPDVDLGDTLRIVAKANSENGGNITKDMTHEAELPVKYAVFIIATATEASTKYVNFTAGEEEGSKNVEHRYEVKNLRERSIPVSVMFQIPIKLKEIQVWNVSEVIPSQPELAKCVLERETLGAMNFEKLERPLVGIFPPSSGLLRSLLQGDPL
ncbi:integrin alpha-X-like isoform X2 [Tiliqua scincoides]|uniref:integrin alpha-X-like isoform X2 n=1 Tax=Tiliqua scincoides TaxID=71010 RepID=UPI003462A3C1